MRRTLTCVGLLLAGAAIMTACASPTTSGDSSDPAAIEGVWGDSTADNAPYLGFSADGEVVGSDGGNARNGTSKFDGETGQAERGASPLKGGRKVDPGLGHVDAGNPTAADV